MDNIGKIIAAVGSFTALAASFGLAYLTGSHDVQVALAGLSGGMAMSVVGYYFGSSSGSAKKDDALIGSVTPPPTVVLHQKTPLSNPPP